MIPEETKKILSSLQGPTLDEVLSISLAIGYDSYYNNTHNTNKVDVAGLEEFCKKLYIDWRNTLIQKKKDLTEQEIKIRETLINNPIFDPNNIAKQKSKTPFYNFFYKAHDKYFPGNKFIFGQLQDHKNIIPDDGPDDGFFHVFGWNVNLMDRGPTDARLYLNLKAENIMKFASIAYDKCKRDNLPFCFKFASSDYRNDPFLFYSSYENLPKFIAIIEEIRKEQPSLLEGCNLISNKLAKINGYIGYGEEPLIKNKKGEYYSYSSLRSAMITDIKNELVELKKSSFPTSINKDAIFGNGKTLDECCKEILFKKMKDQIKINNLAKNEVAENVQSLTDNLINVIRRYVLTKQKKTHIISKSGKLSIDLDLDVFIKELSSYAPEKLDNITTAMGYISKFVSYENVIPNQNEVRLINIIKDTLITHLKEIQKTSPRDKQLATTFLERIEKAPKDPIGKALLLRSTASFIEKGGLYLHTKDKSYTFDSVLIDVYRKYYGDDKIDAIINKHAHNYGIDPKYVYFNNTTVSELNNTSQKKSIKI